MKVRRHAGLCFEKTIARCACQHQDEKSIALHDTRNDKFIWGISWKFEQLLPIKWSEVWSSSGRCQKEQCSENKRQRMTDRSSSWWKWCAVIRRAGLLLLLQGVHVEIRLRSQVLVVKSQSLYYDTLDGERYMGSFVEIRTTPPNFVKRSPVIIGPTSKTTMFWEQTSVTSGTIELSKKRSVGLCVWSRNFGWIWEKSQNIEHHSVPTPARLFVCLCVMALQVVYPCIFRLSA